MVYTFAIHGHLEVGLDEKPQARCFPRGQMAEHRRGIVVPFRLSFRVGREADHQFGLVCASGWAGWSLPIQHVMLQEVMLFFALFLFNRTLAAVLKMDFRKHMFHRPTRRLREREVQHIHRCQGHQHIGINHLCLFEHCLRRTYRIARINQR